MTDIHGPQTILTSDHVLVLCERAGGKIHRESAGTLQERSLRPVPWRISLLHPDGAARLARVHGAGLGGRHADGELFRVPEGYGENLFVKKFCAEHVNECFLQEKICFF